jgi:two-component system response regulator YesN
VLLETALEPIALDEVVNRVRMILSSCAGVMRELPRMGPHVARAIEWLSANYREDTTNDRLAGVVGLPAARLSRAFRAETGLTVKNYHTKLRVEVATVHIATTGEKLAAIAGEVGFCDASHLSRSFVQHRGHRPSLQRQRRSL